MPRQFEPPERTEVVAGQSGADRAPEDPRDPEWRMSSLPETEPPKRRVWLWVLIGIVLFCVLLFCGFSIFIAYTDTGRDLMDDLSTRAAEIATPVE